jgi:hypothetical protein
MSGPHNCRAERGNCILTKAPDRRISQNSGLLIAFIDDQERNSIISDCIEAETAAL